MATTLIVEINADAAESGSQKVVSAIDKVIASTDRMDAGLAAVSKQLEIFGRQFSQAQQALAQSARAQESFRQSAGGTIDVLRKQVQSLRESAVEGVKGAEALQRLSRVTKEAQGYSRAYAEEFAYLTRQYKELVKDANTAASATVKLSTAQAEYNRQRQLSQKTAGFKLQDEIVQLNAVKAAQEQLLSGIISLTEYKRRLIAVTGEARTGNATLAQSFATVREAVDRNKLAIQAMVKEQEKVTVNPVQVAVSTIQTRQTQGGTSPVRGELADLQRELELQKQVRAGILSLVEAEHKLAVAQETAKSGNREQAEALVSLRKQVEAGREALKGLTKAEQDQHKATQQQKDRSQSINQEIAALQRQIAIKEKAVAGTLKLAEAEKQLAIERARTRPGIDSGQATALGTLAARNAALSREFSKAQREARAFAVSLNSLGHSLRRVLEIATGISLVSVLGRAFHEGFAQIRKGIDISNQLEKNRLAIASLLQGTTQLTDGMGALVAGTTAWRINLQEAKNLQLEIAKISAETLGTDIELQDVFRTALSFTRGQKAEVSEVLKLSQALTNVGKLQGLEATRLTDETRQILQLETNRGQTVLQLLGISIKQAREYKQQGTLVQELNKALSVYNELAKESALTFEGLVTSVKTFAQLFSAAVFETTFNALKQVLIGARDELDKLRQSGGLSAALGASNADLRNLGASLARSFAIIQISIASLANTLFVLASAFTKAGDSPKTLEERLSAINETVKKVRTALLTAIRDIASIIESNRGTIQAGLAILSGGALAAGHPVLATGLFTAAVNVPSADSAKTARENAQEQLNQFDATERLNTSLADLARTTEYLGKNTQTTSSVIRGIRELLNQAAAGNLELTDANKKTAESFGFITDRVQLAITFIPEFKGQIQSLDEVARTTGANFVLLGEGLRRIGSSIDDLEDNKLTNVLESIKNKGRDAALALAKTVAESTGNIARVNQLAAADARAELEKTAGAAKDNAEVQEAIAESLAAQAAKQAADSARLEIAAIERVRDAAQSAATIRQSEAQATADVQVATARTAVTVAEQEYTQVERLAGADQERIAILEKVEQARQRLSTATLTALRTEQSANAQNLQFEQRALSDLIAKREEANRKLAAIPQAQRSGNVDADSLISRITQFTDAINQQGQKVASLQAQIRTGTAQIAQEQADAAREQFDSQQKIHDVRLQSVENEIALAEQLSALRKSALDVEQAELGKRASAASDLQQLREAEVELLRETGASDEVIAIKEREILVLIAQQVQQRIQSAQAALQQAQIEATQATAALSKVQALASEEAARNALGKVSLDTATKLAEAKKKEAAATTNVIDKQAELATAQNAVLVKEQEARQKILELQREAAKNAVLAVSDIRGFFDNFITGVQQGNQKFSKIFSDFGQSTGAKFFKQMLIGKNDNFDAPIIENVSGLFGVNGIIGTIMGEGGAAGFANFASAFQQSAGSGGGSGIGSLASILVGGGSASLVSNFGAGFRNLGKTSSDSFNAGFDASTIDWKVFDPSSSGGTFGFTDFGMQSGTAFQQGFDANTIDWKLADNLSQTPGWKSSDIAQLGGQSGSIWVKGFGAGLAGFAAGDMISSLFGIGQSKTGQLGSKVGGAALGLVGFAIAGPIGAAIGAALGNILGGIIGDLFKPGRIQVEKGKIEKFFEEVFKDLNFKIIKETAAAQGFAAYREGTDAALALGAVYARSIGDKATQGTIVRFAGQLLGNFEAMGVGAEAAKKRIEELAKAMGADLADAIDAINGLTESFSKNQKNSLLSLQEFQEEMEEARRNLAQYGDTTNLTAKQLTELATANGNTGSRIVTYGQLITGAIQVNTAFADSTLIATQVQRLLADRFDEVVKAQGNFVDKTQGLSDEVRKGNLSLEEAIVAYNALRTAAGLAALELKDFTLDPEKIKKLAEIIKTLATTFTDLKKNLGEGLGSALSGNLDPAKFSQTFDQLMNDTLKSSIIKAIVTGFTEGTAIENLKPLSDAINTLLVDVGTGNLSLTDFSAKLNDALAANKDNIDNVKDAWIAAAEAGQEVLKQFTNNSINIQGLTGAISDALTQGLTEGLDPSKYGERFDELFNNVLKTAIISAIVQGFVKGLALETLKPMFDTFQSLLKDLGENKISFDDFRTQFHAAFDAARGDIDKLKAAFEEIGRAGTDLVKELSSQTLDIGGLKSALASALQEGLNQGLDPRSYERKFNEVLRTTLRNSVISALVDGFTKGFAVETLRPLFEKLQGLFKSLREGTLSSSDFTTQFQGALQAAQPQLAAIRQGFIEVANASDQVLKSLGLWAPSLDELESKLDDINDQIDQLAQRKIDIQVTLNQRLADIGIPGAALKAVDVEQEFVQKDLAKQLAKPGVAPGTTLPNPNDLRAVQQFGKDITKAMDDIRRLGDLEVQRYHVLEGQIQERYSKEVEAIKKAGDAEQKSIKASFDAQIEASKDRVKALNKEKEAQKESLEALEKQVALAKQFQDVGNSIRDALVNIGGSGKSPVSPQGQFSFLERTADKIRGELANAPVEQQPDIIKRLSDVLQQQLNLDVFQRPSAQYREQFNKIVGELERLQDMAERMGGGAEDLQRQLLELQQSQDATLKSIEAQIEAEQELQEKLADDQRAALEAASARVEAALIAAESGRDAEIIALREVTAARLEELAAQEAALADRAEGVLMTQRDILLEQLAVLRSIDSKLGGGTVPAGAGVVNQGTRFLPQVSNGTTLQGPLGRDLSNDPSAQLTNLPSAHGVTTITDGAPTSGGFDPRGKPGRRWDGSQWVFSATDPDVVWDAGRNQYYLHNQPITDAQVQDLLRNGLRADRQAREASAVSVLPPTARPYGNDVILPSLPNKDVYGAGQGGDVFFGVPPTEAERRRQGSLPPFASASGRGMGMSFAANGFHGLVTQPHAFIVAERQPEFVDIANQHEGRGGGAYNVTLSSGDIHVNVTGGVDDPEAIGRAIGKAAAKERQKEMETYLRSVAGRKVVGEIAKNEARRV